MATSKVATLPHDSRALSRPSDLWIVPSPERSQWFAHIDWYLNFQMCKGRHHTRVKPSPELFHILEEGGLEYQETPAVNKAPLLVISGGRIPTEKCLLIDGDEPMKEWLKTAEQVAHKLKAKHVHVFLPQGFERRDVESHWKNFADKNIEVEFSLDEDAL